MSSPMNWPRETCALVVIVMAMLLSAPAMGESPTAANASNPSGIGYSWLRFSDEDVVEDTVDAERMDAVSTDELRVARQTPIETQNGVGSAAQRAESRTVSNTENCSCGAACCDNAKCKSLAKAVAASHKPLFYDNDFGYVLDPCYDGWWPGDHLKRMCVSDGVTVDVGGQYRARYHGEQNMRGLGLTGRDDDFLLQRLRLYTNVQLGSNLRFFAEYIDAVSDFESLSPRPIEENRSDLLNLFVDGTLFCGHEGELKGRVGRQELLYGAQRLVSPLDWSNTRRTFDGGKLMWRGTQWDIDGFWTRPVFPDARQFDNPNLDQQFYGLYSRYKGFIDETIDIYWLTYDNDASPFRYNTVGSRYYGTHRGWLTELEGGYQFGDNSDGSDHNAGFITAGVGRSLSGVWKPELWLYYDWASGTDDLAAGNGFDQLFPLAHKYLGFMDLFGRRNIETPNVLLTVQPTHRLKLLMWYYYLFLENKNDSPYNVAMQPISNVVPGSADLGHEIDLAATYSINARTSLLLGYSHFFSGDYFDTPGIAYSGDGDFFYTQLTFNF